METINITVKINLDFSDDVKSFLSNIFSGTKTVKQEAPKTEAPKVVTTSTPAATTTTTKLVSKVIDTDPSEVQEYTDTKIRSIMATKLEDNREAIREKLTALGSKNVTNLDPAKYAEFADFLNAL